MRHTEGRFLQAIEKDIAGKKEGQRLNEMVQSNVAALNSDEAKRIINAESMGGNAGSGSYEGEKATFIALNSYAEPSTGKIIKFGNFQNLSPGLIEGKLHLTIKLGFFMPKNFEKREDIDFDHYIFKILYPKDSEISEEVNKIMEETKGRYNIGQVKSWMALEHALKALGNTKSSSDEIFDYKKIWGAIGAVRAGNLDINVITNTYGLRDKVIELMKK